MGGIVSGITDAIGLTDSGAAGDASVQASRVQAASQREALNYLKQTEALPQQFRQGALKGLAGVAGLAGGTGSQQDLIDRSRESPLFAAIMGGRDAGEESILRNAAATGGLRSGASIGDLTDFNTQLQNTALLESYNQQLSGLQGLANLPSNANAIAQQTSNIGQTLAQGQVAGAQATQAAQNQMFGDATSLAGLDIMAFSDYRLKENIIHIGESGGHRIYKWNWNDEARSIGIDSDIGVGVLADEVSEYMPEAIGYTDGYMTVNYEMIGVQNANS